MSGLTVGLRAMLGLPDDLSPKARLTRNVAIAERALREGRLKPACVDSHERSRWSVVDFETFFAWAPSELRPVAPWPLRRPGTAEPAELLVGFPHTTTNLRMLHEFACRFAEDYRRAGNEDVPTERQVADYLTLVRG
jgi:hypothetical protein